MANDWKEVETNVILFWVQIICSPGYRDAVTTPPSRAARRVHTMFVELRDMFSSTIIMYFLCLFIAYRLEYFDAKIVKKSSNWV